MKESDFVVHDFRFQNGETLPELRLHYVTLGTPKRDLAGHVTNAALLLHGTNGSGKTILDNLGSQLFGSGQPLDSAKYYLIIPDCPRLRRLEQAERWLARQISALRL